MIMLPSGSERKNFSLRRALMINQLKRCNGRARIWTTAIVFFVLQSFSEITDHSFLFDRNAVAAAGPDWSALGQPVKASSSVFVDVDASRHALNPSLALIDSLPFLGWIELNSHGVSRIYVWRWDRSRWMKTGESLNMDATHRAMDLVMSANDKAPYLAWIEPNAKDIPQLYVKHLRGDQWVIDGGSLNVDPNHRAANPTLSATGPVPYVAWSEYNDQRIFRLYVKHLSEDGWRMAGIEGLNISPSRDAIEPALALQGPVPYITWIELSDQNFYQVYVKRWDGSYWDLLGGSLNMDPMSHASSPSIAFLGETPYTAWIEINAEGVSQLHVKHWDNGSWLPDGKSLNIDPGHHALSPSIAQRGATLYVTWAEHDANGVSRIHVKHWTGDQWESDDQNLNTVPTTAAASPSLAASDSALYVAWKEVFTDGLFRIIVKRLQAE
jgi:hypothetical protein